MHQFSDSYSMPLLQRTENSVISSGSAEQYSNRWNIPCSLMCLFLGWGIYFWPYNERGTGGGGPVFLAQGSHITETAHQPAVAAGRRIKGPVGSPVHSTALLFFILSSQKWVVWIQAGACWLEKSVGSLRPHLCFSCLTRRVPILSVIMKLIEEPERKLYFPAPPLQILMGGVPMWLHAKFALTLSADTLLVESQLHLISWWAVSADFPAVCVYSFSGF